MIDLYKKYYLDEETIKHLLDEGIIVFDTSALLDLYYYSEKTRGEIFEKVFAFLQNRLWISSQVYFEYLKNKSKVASKPIDSYRKLISKRDKGNDGGYVDAILNLSKEIGEKSVKSIRGQFKTLQEQTQKEDKHPYFPKDIYKEYEEKLSAFEASVTDFVNSSIDFKNSFIEKVDERIKEFESVEEDVVYKTIIECFQIGSEYSYSDLMEIAKEGTFRYEELIPPGYKDAGEKIGLQKYGDLFSWKQILNYAKRQKKDVILVINDVKEDWFEPGKKIPRYELLREFRSVVNKSIWLMPMSDFLYQINTLLDSQLDETTITDVENVFESREEQELEKVDLQEPIQKIFTNVFNEGVYLIDSISINYDIRIFGKPLLYEAEDEEGEKYRVIVNILNAGNYAKALHALTNAFEIKKIYDENGETYRYYNFVVLKNKELYEKFQGHLLKKNLRNKYNNKKIKTIICYFDKENIAVMETNFSKG